MEELDKIIQRLYEDSVLGKLSDARYMKDVYKRQDTDYRSIADSSNIITNGCCKPLTHDDIYEILMDCR